MLFLSLKNRRNEDVKYMEENGFPNAIIERAKASSAAMLIPNRPSSINGESRWAWLEIDPDTYETISVTDTGEHGGFAEYLMSMERVSPTGEDYQVFMTGAFLGVTTSVWSVSSFALMLDDYEQILNAAKAYTYGLGEVLSGMLDMKDLAKLEYNWTPIKLKLVNKEYDYLQKFVEPVNMGKKGDWAQDVVNFIHGFKAGAAHYFKQAEAAIE